MPLPAPNSSAHHSYGIRMNDHPEDEDITSQRPNRAPWQEDSEGEEEEEVYIHPAAANFEDGDISLASPAFPRTNSIYRYEEHDVTQQYSPPETPRFEHTHDLGEGVVSVRLDDDGDLSTAPSQDFNRSGTKHVTETEILDKANSEIIPKDVEQSRIAAVERSIPDQPTSPGPHTPRTSEDRRLSQTSLRRSSSQNPKSAPSSPSASHRAPPKAEAVSAWSHQHLAPHADIEDESSENEGEWQDMPVFARHDIYNDDGKIIAKQNEEESGQPVTYANLGGAAKGYTKVTLDDDARSATSMDEETAYLFDKDRGAAADEYDEDLRDPLAQMQATKDLLTDNQRIAYVGVVRLAMADMIKDVESIERTRAARKEVDLAKDTIKLWAQQMMVRVYAHMELDSAEQLMIEQLAQHGLQPSDLTPTLMQNARVKNPISDQTTHTTPETGDSVKAEGSVQSPASEQRTSVDRESNNDLPPPPYETGDGEDMPQVRTPAQLPTTDKLDIDIRWTVLCDLFLVLISGSSYDARSRSLLERVGSFLSVSWLDICRFEKRVTDALEMQQEGNKEDWDEAENMEKRKKEARRKRLIVMGLATVGGGLVIGLSAGLLAPVIGAGLAAGFTTIGVSGTGTFLAGAGGAAVIGGGAAVTGGTIGGRAASRRTGAVKTFEYRPLHNNKRVNLVVTVAGWMTGKVDDVRLPYSTVDPIMGDLYSIYWEPEMLRSMGDTINILATEALTQGLQQILGSTILISLMAAIQLPVVLTKLAYLIDNPWSNSLSRADMSGLILADSLIERSLGSRPITLVGFSLGSRLIFSCLNELAKRGAVGLIQNVYLFGSPVIAKKDDYLKARTVVSGRFVNGYATNDWILGYLFRATSGGIARVAGLAAVNVNGIENIDVTAMVPGHMAYRAAMPKLLREVGWAVTSDEFDEIEDPDPENHEKRQRELINDIEEARKGLQEKSASKRFFGLFRSKKGKKKEWETYDEASRNQPTKEDPAEGASAAGPVVFDVDAITKEVAGLAAQGMEMGEAKSSPSMMTNSSPSSSRPRTPTNFTAAESSNTKHNADVRFPSQSSSTRIPSSSSKELPSHPSPPSSINHGYDSDSYNHNSTFSDDTITMTFGSPDISRRSEQSTFSYNRTPDTASPRLNPNTNNFYRQHSNHNYQSSTSLDLGSERRSSPHHLNGSAPSEHNPSSRSLTGRTESPHSSDVGSRATGYGQAREEEARIPSPSPLPINNVTEYNQRKHNEPKSRNVWADDDDEDDFGREREMEMTFE